MPPFQNHFNWWFLFLPSSSSSKQLRPSRGTCPGPRTAASRATCPSQPKKRKKINGKKKDPEMLKIKYYGCSLVRVNSQRAAGPRKSILCTQSPQGLTPFTFTFLNDFMHFYAGYLATKKKYTSGKIWRWPMALGKSNLSYPSWFYAAVVQNLQGAPMVTTSLQFVEQYPSPLTLAHPALAAAH